MKLTVIQLAAVSDVALNIAAAKDLMDQAVAADRPDWIQLPEHFHWAGGTVADRMAAAEILGQGPAYRFCQNFARENRVNVHAGSIFERVEGDSRIYNTTVAFDRSGNEVARYRKIHLFDIIGPDGTRYCESDTVNPGDQVVVYEVDGVRIGCGICYDLRFPDLFQALVQAGAHVIALPSAFTMQTGKDHWEPLLRARAIETQTYVAAAGLCGTVVLDDEKHSTYGHSLIANPWGHIVAMAADGPGYTTATMDLTLIDRVRRQIPLAEHRAARRGTMTFAGEMQGVAE